MPATPYEKERYSKLIKSIIGGSFYESTGVVVPYKAIAKTTLRLETSSANTKYAIYLNDVYAAEAQSDVNGNVVFSVKLPKGEIEVVLRNMSTGKTNTSYITTRDYALWLASYAEVLEEIDDNIQEARDDIAIETATSNGIEDHFGWAVETYNNIGQDLDSYRWSVHELRLAYRNWGSRFLSLDFAVGSFTNTTPFGFSRRLWGPNWVLDQNMLENHRFLNRAHELSWGGVGISGVELIEVDPCVESSSVIVGTHQLRYNADGTFDWFNNSQTNTSSTVAADGLLYIPGPWSDIQAQVLGRRVPNFNVVAATNDMLYININEIGTLSVQLTTGLPTPSGANVVTDINTALVADARYGAPYNFSAGTVGADNRVYVSVPAAGSGTNTVRLESGPNNAAPAIFGATGNDIKVTGWGSSWGLADSVVFSKLEGDFDALATGYIERRYTAGVETKELRWQYGAAGYGLWQTVETTGYYILTDLGGNELTVFVDKEEMPETNGVDSFTTTFSREAEEIGSYGGIWINVDTASLPVGPVTETVILTDDSDHGYAETPDNWFFPTYTGSTAISFLPSLITRGRASLSDPVECICYQAQDFTLPSCTLIGKVKRFPLSDENPTTSLYPNKYPGLAYNYEGFELKFSAWLLDMTGTTNNYSGVLSISFDGGDTWTNSIAADIHSDTTVSYRDTPNKFEVSAVIPPNITTGVAYPESGILVKILVTNKTGLGFDVVIDSPSVEVTYISSRYLTHATVARTEHTQYFGELMYVWSPTELSITEKEYIGLPHKAANTYVPFSGVEIAAISEDTPAGQGVLTYEYNSISSTKRLKWIPYGNVVGTWYNIFSDGTYTLTANDGSYITVNTVFSLMPVLSDTPPATRTRTLTITDATVNQGHVRKIAPAHADIDIYDATEFDSDGEPINLVGSITEADFSLAGLINCKIEDGSPFRFAYVGPEYDSPTGEELSFSPVGPNYEATLYYYSDQDATETILYEDGVPLPNDKWSYVDATTISILGAYFTVGAEYTIDYNILYEVTTTVYDLGANVQDYAWYADYYLWERYDSEMDSYEIETPVFFNPDTGVAYLGGVSDQSKSTSQLIVSINGVDDYVPQRYWEFLDGSSIRVDIGRLVAGQYRLSHNEKRVYEVSNINKTFEHRSATTATGIVSEPWTTIDRNTNIYVNQSPVHRYHQLRMRISSIRDLRDFRLRGLFFKGLQIHGSTPNVIGLTNIWGNYFTE